jgi:hypothetical protein
MTNRDCRVLALGVAIASTLTWSGAALALSGGSYTPPGGQLPATVPGGTEGRAGPRNVDEAVRSGHAYPAAPDGRYRARRLQPGSDPYGR